MSWRAHLPLLTILLAAALCFARAVGFPFVNWDDPSHLLQNELTAAPLGQGLLTLLTTPEHGYPMPVVTLTYAAVRALFGLEPVAFHALNLALHLVNVTLVYLLALRLGAGRGTAARVALILALHPLVVEPVCWVTGLKDLLATGLVLGAMVVALGPPDREEAPTAARWLGALLLGLLALLAKPAALLLPVLLWLVLRHRFPDRGRIWPALQLLPLVAVAAAVAVVGVRGSYGVGAVAARDLAGAALDVTGAYTMQLLHLVWPRGLSAAYYRGADDPHLALILLASAALIALVVAAVKLTPRRSLTRLGLLLAAVAYLPVSNLFAYSRWVADAYMYLPLVGLALALVSLGERLWPARLERVSQPAWIALALVLAGLCWIQAETWSSSAELWRNVVQRYPQNPVPLARLGLGYIGDGDKLRGARVLVSLRRRFPAYDELVCDQAWAFQQLGQQQRALRLLERGVRQRRRECTQRLVQLLLAAGRAPPGTPREVIGLAFEQALPVMRRQVKDPRIFARAAQLLERQGLRQLAAQARAGGSP